MSKLKAKTYAAEFRQSAVKLAIESDQSISDTAKELGVKPSTLHTWIGKYSQQKESKVSRTDEHL